MTADDAVDLGTGLTKVEEAARSAWREARASTYVGDWLVVGVTLLVLASVGVLFYGVMGAGLSLAAGVLLGWAAVLARYDNPWVHAAASLVSVAAAVFLAALLYLSLGLGAASAAVGVAGLLGVFGLVLAATGAATAVSGVDEVVYVDVARTAWLTASGFLLAWIVVASPRGEQRQALIEFLVDLASSASSLALAPSAGDAVYGFFGLLAASSLAAALALSKTPWDRLTTSTGVSKRMTRLSQLLYAGFVASTAFAVVSFVLSSGLTEDVGETGVPPLHLEALSAHALGGVAAAVVSLELLRWFFTVVLLASFFVFAGAVVYSWLRDGFLERFVYRKTAVAVGFAVGFLAGSMAVAAGFAAELADAVDAGEGFGGVAFADIGGFALVNLSFAAALLLLVVFSLVLEAVRLAVAPSGWTSPAFASTGLFLLGVSAVLLGLYIPGLLAAAAALYVWDVGRYAAVLKRSLPRGGATSSLELVHAAGGLFLAFVAVVAAFVIYMLAPYLAPADPVVGVVGLVAALAVVNVLVRSLESSV